MYFGEHGVEIFDFVFSTQCTHATREKRPYAVVSNQYHQALSSQRAFGLRDSRVSRPKNPPPLTMQKLQSRIDERRALQVRSWNWSAGSLS